MISQRNHGQFIRSTAIARKINRKITLVFLYFPRIEKNISQLFCTSDIENINQAIDIYEKYDKKIPLGWQICTSTDIFRTLPKLNTNLEKFENYLLSTFYLLINIFQEKIIPEEENIKLLIENKKKSFNFYLDQKNFRQEKKIFAEKQKKNIFDQNFFFYVKSFL